MDVELRVPQVGESILEVQLGDWVVREGDHVERDQPVVVLETEKATVEVPSSVEGIVKEIRDLPGFGAPDEGNKKTPASCDSPALNFRPGTSPKLLPALHLSLHGTTEDADHAFFHLDAVVQAVRNRQVGMRSLIGLDGIADELPRVLAFD